jgi:hypothetical protein
MYPPSLSRLPSARAFGSGDPFRSAIEEVDCGARGGRDRSDAFVLEFNCERPHEALAMKCPAEIYTPSPRVYNGLPELGYPFHDRNILVTACGRICLHRCRSVAVTTTPKAWAQNRCMPPCRTRI